MESCLKCEENKKITTFTFWNSFKNCRKKCQIRYLLGYVPLEEKDSLTFGSAAHSCLEHWYGAEKFEVVADENMLCYSDGIFKKQILEANLREDQEIKLIAIMQSYIDKYPEEKFKIIEVEQEFEDDIINPETGHKSRSFTLAGKVDGVVQKEDGSYWILEHKTASKIDAGYISKLWTDFQIILYAYSIERKLGIKITGIIYNILTKCGLKMKEGETEEQYKLRKAELIAKSKTGKSSAKQQIAESREEFFERCMQYYNDKEDLFHREEIILDRNMIKELQIELWDLTKSFLEAQKRGVFYKNNNFCFHYNSACEYYPYCSSREDEFILQNFFKKKEAHSELETVKKF